MARYVTNCPLSGTNNRSFFLLVETWGANSTYVKQTLTYYNTNATYTRTCSNNTWGSWSKLSQDGHTHNYAASSHTHTKSQITDFPTSMTPTSHTHGSIANGGTLNSDITSVNKVVVTDSSNNLKTISKVPFANLNITKANITGLGIPASDTNTTYSAGTGLSLSSTTFSAKIANNLTTTTTGSSLDATQGKALNDKVTAITSLNKSVQTITSFSNSFSGTMKWMIKNGWMFITFENLKCTSTNSGFVAITSLAYGPETNDMVYWNFYPANLPSAVSVRVTSAGSVQARCFTANSVVNGHMSFPCKLL